ncbi:MAG: methyltransferase [Clostridia bacterium]|nr:methyltransferase [Clostridia bacterium]
MKLEVSERLEDLQCQGLKIVQNKNLYTFTSDSVILANFIDCKPKDVLVEIGAGSGVISILLQAKKNLKKIYAFEIQESMQQLCEKNVLLNCLQEKIEIVKDDAKNHAKHVKNASIDVVFSNPPYFRETNFKQNEVKKIAKEETKLSCAELVTCAKKMLKDGGSFYCCYSAERSCELISTCQQNGLAVKEMFFTENGKGEVKLVVIKAVKGGKNGVKVFPNLVTNEEDGKYLESLHTKYVATKE